MIVMRRVFISFLLSATFSGSVLALDYWTGGAGVESRQNAPSHYNTTFEFFARDGAYLSGIEVTLSALDEETLLETVTEGPWVSVDLEPGRYRIVAIRPSTQETQRVRFEVTDDQPRTLGLRYLQ